MRKILKHTCFSCIMGMLISILGACNKDENSIHEPTSDFSYTANDLIVQFNSETEYAVSLAWDFGDGVSSTGVNPSHTYETEGDYEVTLIATGTEGSEPVTVTKTITIVKINPIADFEFETYGLSAMFTNSSERATSYSWHFGDGETSSEENPTHIYSASGEYSVVLTVMGAEGSTPDSITITVNVVAFFQPIAVENADFSLPGTGRLPNWANIPGWSSDSATVDSGVEEGGWWMPADDNDYSGELYTGDTSAYNLTDHVIASGEEFKFNFSAFDIWNGSSITVTLYYNNGSGVRNVLGTQTFNITSGEWNYSLEFIVMATTESVGAKIGIEVENASGDGGDGWTGFDDIQLFYR